MLFNPSDWPKKVEALPKTLDRFRGTSVFFDIKFPSFLTSNPDARKWTSWGAVSSLISIPEVIPYDMEAIGRLDEWERSAEKQAISSHRNFRVLKEIRNYEMHMDYTPRLSHLYADESSLKEKIGHDDVFFSALDWDELQKLRNVARRNPTITRTEVEDFNIYTTQYSVRGIIERELERIADHIVAFLDT